MTTINLTETELFKSFAEMGTGESYVDLHNEFECDSINYSLKLSQLSLTFKASKNNLRKIRHVEIIFKNVKIALMNFKVDNTPYNSCRAIDMIYRGRFEDENSELKESSDEGKYYYYIDFLDDYSFEIFSDYAIAELK
jgi:hypothetical protein